MSRRPLPVVPSEILRSFLQRKSAFRMVAFFAMGQMPAAMELVSWSLEVLRTKFFGLLRLPRVSLDGFKQMFWFEFCIGLL